ncbi:MAG: MFS transporter [Pseudomonadales bacterium]|nr:MFS transporter [Pseudomonadales bacterium]
MFRSLGQYNYRLWAGGALVSNVGTWMQRVAQDWLVLTQLTHSNATAVGVVMSLQFGPQLLLLPLTGWATDHLDRRKLLMVTQTSMGILALGLGILTVTGRVQLWQVYMFACGLGCISAFDAPARQTFVSELVGEQDLSNAVALNSSSFNAARMIGPAMAGILIAAVGCGWAFLINAASFMAVLLALSRLRLEELHGKIKVDSSPGGFLQGFYYVWQRSELKAALLMLFLVGTFGLNFPIFISTMAVSAFHTGAGRYGMLTSCMAMGSVIGALMVARRARPQFLALPLSAAAFGTSCSLAAIMPNEWSFGMILVVTGISVQTLTTTTNSLVQLGTEPALRGRVMAILLAIILGSTPLGAPLVGWVADRFGPRWALAVGATSGFCAALIGLHHLLRRQRRWPVSDSFP